MLYKYDEQGVKHQRTLLIFV